MQPICTVVLTTYNHVKYFRQSIESVLSQKTKYPFIIHVHDDASTDGTSELVREYAIRYPDKVKAFISEKNQGAQTNIYNSLRSVQTKYCATMKTDDYWCDDTKLEKQIQALEENPECSFCGGQTIIDTSEADNSQKQLLNNKYHIDPNYYLGKSIITLEDVYKYQYKFKPHTSSIVYRTNHVNWNEIKHKETFCYDFNRFYYFLLKGSMYLFKDVLSCYRVSSSGSWSTQSYYEKACLALHRYVDLLDDTGDALWKRIVQDLTTYLNHFVACDNAEKGIMPREERKELVLRVLGIPLFKIKEKKNSKKYYLLEIPVITVKH